MTSTLATRTDWSAIAAADLADVIALRRAIHAEPEVGLNCPLTTAKAKAALSGLPLEIHDSTSTTGFVAILRGGRAGGDGSNGRTVLLRGDMDALPMTEETGLPFASTIPGAMHACGHDAHTAMLAGAARALCARREELSGTIVFMFQPGEEGHHGARHMIADGLLDIARPEAAFALHILPNAPAGMFVAREGAMLASTDTVLATIRGTGGHAAMPHEAIDPIPVACAIVTALQQHVARRVPVADPAVLTITQFHAGSSHNIIPGEVRLMGTLRTLSNGTRTSMREAFHRIAQGIAAAHGCVADTSIDEGYPVTMNDPRATRVMRELAAEVPGAAGWTTMPAPIMGGEDFSYVLREVPGALAFLGVAAPGSDWRTNPPLHNTRMTIDEQVMATGVAMHCAVAERFLERGLD
ncbi:amidohydrolase [Sphingomonas sp. Leaf231]|uniref:M20 metallopeptidase family protein n=1 Tax=Sphingomonas sp. Leaf231 TaxID=1736301 RepID=UPI0006FA362D|nr:M20 family metallopeptidase [Sphingomonas sp. Leaf231]KQN94097.1 amidohydrolase [Sphingomonas sp. Leaf231]